MKRVSFLLEKHRKDVWTDNADDIWFYDGVREQWRVVKYWGGELFLLRQSKFKPTSEYGPFKRLWKGPR